MRTQYITVPIELYRRFLDNPKSCLYDILCYLIADYTKLEDIKADFESYPTDWRNAIKRGKELKKQAFNGTLFSTPRDIWFDYLRNADNKKRTDLLDFLAYQALKTKQGKKQYGRLTNYQMFQLMAGYATNKDFNKAYTEYWHKYNDTAKEHVIECYGIIGEYLSSEQKMKETGRRIKDRLTQKHKFYHYSFHCRYFVFMFSNKGAEYCAKVLVGYVEKHRKSNRNKEFNMIVAEERAKAKSDKI